MKIWTKGDPHPYDNLVRAEQISYEGDRHGVVDDGNIAWPERIAEARRSWVQADPADFEQLDRRGRLFRDRATGTEYKRAYGAPLLTLGGEANRGIATFFVADERLVFLRPADFETTLWGPTSFVIAGRVDPSPGVANDSPRIL